MTEGGGEEELTEEEMIARAIEMSMNPETEEKKKVKKVQRRYVHVVPSLLL